MIDRDIHLARALLVESNALLRSVTVAQLKDLGVGDVSQASRVKDARMLLEREKFDIVICNREFEGSPISGQDLLDELRREQLLPMSTVFIMVAGHATYAQVVEAGESALDGILVRPYTAAALGERLMEARNRKRALADIFSAMEKGELEIAFARALKRFNERQPYAGFCGRLAAELLLRMDRHDDARKVFDKLAAANGAAWAHLGAARAQMAGGDNAGARKAILDVLAQDPKSADAHDLLGRILVEQCDFDGALAEYSAAAEITPGCLLRTQHAGALAFYQGRSGEAQRCLQRTLTLGVQTKLFDALSLVLLAMLHYDQGDALRVAQMREQLQRYRERFPESRRLKRFERMAQTLAAWLSGPPEQALELLRELSAEAAGDDFDLEASNVLLALWSRIPETARPSAEHEALLDDLGMRFCVSKAMAEVLMAAAQRQDMAVAAIRRCQARVFAVAEEAMGRSMRGEPGVAVQQLLEAGESTRNAKLLEMAGHIARRHRASLPDADALAERAAELVKRSCQAMSHIAGIQRSGRSPGGLQLRGTVPQEAAQVPG